MILVIFGIVFAAALFFIVKKRNDAKNAKTVTTSQKRTSQVVKPKPKAYTVPKGQGYDSNGNPVKMPNEVGADFKAREAHHYYVNGRS